MLYDGEGLTGINLDSSNVFLQLPAYIGANTSVNDGIQGHISSDNPSSMINVKMNVSGVGGYSNYGPILLDDQGNEIPLKIGENFTNIRNGATFTTKRDDKEICYIVFEDMSVVQQ